MKNLVSSVLSLGKVLLKSRASGKSSLPGKGKALIIMGNGPSLRETLANDFTSLASHDTTAVNFAANTPDFFRVRPRHYVLADPLFFHGADKDPNVAKLWENLRKVDWQMTLHLPVGNRPQISPRITLQHFNMTPGEGYDFVCHPLFSKAMAMPRPRNVLIPAIMEGIRDGYGSIYITGADHTWPHSLYVDDLNRVVSVQPHFYEDDKKELDRVAREYAGLHIHDVLGSMVVAFRSYHQIAEYAKKKGVTIINSTPGSLIDAFERRPLP